MPDMWIDVDSTVTEIPINIMSLIDDGDFKTRETAIAYNESGMDLVWNFVTTNGAMTQTAVTPTTGGGDYDWTNQGDGMYSIGIPASGGASINNDTEGFGWFSGVCDGVLPWRGPIIGFRAAGINNILIDNAYSATRGLAGTALPDATADAAGGLPISDTGGLDLDGILADIPTVAEFEARTISPTAAENLEDTYDGTGYVDNVAPATQAQVGNIASGAAAISTTTQSAPNGFVLTTGTNETNDEDSTHELDGIVHSLEDDGGTTDAYYIFNVGGNGVPVSVSWWGYANANGDSYGIYAWNWVGASWEQIDTINGSSLATIVNETFDLTNAHVGTGANIGEVRLRYYSTDGTKFATDRIICSYLVVFQSVGYEGGAVWIDTNASNTNTESYVDGVADNPVSTLAAATTIANNIGLKRFELLSGSSITLGQAYEGYQFSGAGSTIILNGQSISGCRFFNTTIVGNDSGTNAIVVLFDSCLLTGNKLGFHILLSCGITGDMEFAEENDYTWDACVSIVAGTASPAIDFGSGLNASNFNLRHYSGGIEVKNMGAGTGTYNMSLEGWGQLIINANCSATSNIAIRGNFTITDNAGGAVTLSENARYDVDQVRDAVVDDSTKIDGSALNALSANNPGSTLASLANQTSIQGAGFDTSTDSLEAIRDRGDVAWGGASSFVGLQGGLLLNFRVNEKDGIYIYDNLHSVYKGKLGSDITFVEGMQGRALNFSGVGSVEVFKNFNEVRYSGNPVASSGPNEGYNKLGIYDPSLLVVGNELWMYCSEVGDDGHIREALWISGDDGLTFDYYGVVLDVGDVGEWDDWKAHDVDVIYDSDDATYKMWYNGNLLPDNFGKIGYATSPDGKVWTKYAGNPVFDVDVPGSWDDAGVNYPTVIKEGGIFYMWYGGYNSVPQYNGMGLATSPDGITWTREATNPVLPSTTSHKYTVTKQNNIYWVIFQADHLYKRLYMGYSSDRITWTLVYHPVIDVGATGEWDANVIEDADFMFDGSTARIFYSGATIKGFDNQIGLITIENLEDKLEAAEILNQYPISIACWIKTTDTNSGAGIIKRGNDSFPYNAYILYLTGGRFKAFYSLDDSNYVDMTPDVDDGGIINDGTWHHIIFTVDASGGELFVDLVSQNTVAWTGTPGATTANERLEIGEYTTVLTGQIDDIRIYDHVLTSDERRGIYMGVTYTQDNTLEAIWNLEDTEDKVDDVKEVTDKLDDTLEYNTSNYSYVFTEEALDAGAQIILGTVGDSTVTITIIDQDSIIIQDCSVQIWNTTLDSLVSYGRTNANGQIQLSADDGAYKVKLRKGGFSFADPEDLAVSGDTVITYSGESTIPDAPASVQSCRVYDYLFLPDGSTPVSTANTKARIISLPEDSNSILHSGAEIEGIYDNSTGLVYWDVVKGSEVEFTIIDFGIRVVKIIPTTSTARLVDIT